MCWAFSRVPLWCKEKKRICTGGDSPPSSSLNHKFCKKFPALIQTLRKIDSTPVNRLQIHWQGKQSEGAKNRGRRESQTMKSYAMVNGLRINHGKKNTIPHGPKLTHRRCYSMSEACLGSCPSRCFANEEDTCGCKWRAQETGQPTSTTAKWRFWVFLWPPPRRFWDNQQVFVC